MIADDFRSFDVATIAGPVAERGPEACTGRQERPTAVYLADIFDLPTPWPCPACCRWARVKVATRWSPAAIDWEGRLPRYARCRANRTAMPWQPQLIRGYEVVTAWRTTSSSRPSPRSSAALDRLWRGAQHAGLPGGPGPARHAAGVEPRGRRARHPLWPAVGAKGRAAVHLCPQELLLPGPAQGLPDQPVRDPGGAGVAGWSSSSATRSTSST